LKIVFIWMVVVVAVILAVGAFTSPEKTQDADADQDRPCKHHASADHLSAELVTEVHE